MAPAAKRPLRDAKQISRIGLGEFARFIPIQYAPELDHSHTLKGFRTAHPWPSKGPSITGQIVCYLNRTYHALSTSKPTRINKQPDILYINPIYCLCLRATVTQ